MTQPSFRGVYTALVTPFLQGRLDVPTLQKLVERQIRLGVDGLVPVGTTGESPTLDYDEHIEAIRITVETAARRVPVIAGTGANSTSEALLLTKRAEAAGADGFLQVTPYYNKPSQEGLYRHFATVAESTAKPIVLYSVPSRCGVEIAPATAARLAAAFPHVRTIKEAGGSCDRVAEIILASGGAVTVLSGDDAMTLPFLSIGASGVISVASNLYPQETAQWVKAALAGDWATARQAHLRFYPLFKGLFVESNPVPVKFAMACQGLLPSAETRLPLAPLGESHHAQLRALLATLPVIS